MTECCNRLSMNQNTHQLLAPDRKSFIEWSCAKTAAARRELQFDLKL